MKLRETEDRLVSPTLTAAAANHNSAVGVREYLCANACASDRAGAVRHGTGGSTMAQSGSDLGVAAAVVDLPQAAQILGIGRTLAYRLVREGRWPTPVIRIGRLIKVPVWPL